MSGMREIGVSADGDPRGCLHDQIGGPIDPQQFTFALTNQVPLDLTDEFLRGLGLR